MRKIRRWTREFFSLSHSQANGLLILFPLMLLILFSEPAWRWYVRLRKVDQSADIARLDSIVTSWNRQGSLSRTTESPAPSPVLSAKLFRFNPNTVDSNRMMDLGFSPKIASRVIRYRLKGGRFRIRQDICKIYGLDSTFYSRLYPFIDLPAAARTGKKAEWRHSPKSSFVKEVFPAFDRVRIFANSMRASSGLSRPATTSWARFSRSTHSSSLAPRG